MLTLLNKLSSHGVNKFLTETLTYFGGQHSHILGTTLILYLVVSGLSLMQAQDCATSCWRRDDLWQGKRTLRSTEGTEGGSERGGMTQ